MRYSQIVATLATVASGSTLTTNSFSIDPSLIPDFGLKAGQEPDGTGNCAGSDNTLIPCFCPPDREEFIDKVTSAVASGDFLGIPVTFNTNPQAQSAKDKFDRATTCLIVLQNFRETPGVGCPAASAPNILEQQESFANLD